jgi:hypothetical protein
MNQIELKTNFGNLITFSLIFFLFIYLWGNFAWGEDRMKIKTWRFSVVFKEIPGSTISMLSWRLRSLSFQVLLVDICSSLPEFPPPIQIIKFFNISIALKIEHRSKLSSKFNTWKLLVASSLGSKIFFSKLSKFYFPKSS